MTPSSQPGFDRTVSTRRRTDEAVREDEERLRLALEAAALGTWDYDMRTGIVTQSPRQLEILGLQPGAEVTGIAEWGARVHPDDRERVTRQFATAAEGDGRFESEHRVLRPDGHERWVLVKGSILRDATGLAVRAIGVTADISERKRADQALRESEARYRDLFENANDIIYTLDLGGRITSVNRRAVEAFGYPQESYAGRSAAELIPPEYHGRMTDALERKLTGDANPTVYELEVVRQDGRRVPVEVSSRVILRDGKPVGVQGIARDVTERKQAEQVLRQSEESLREADRRKDEFLAMLAHELRNPLAPIRNAIEVLKLLGPPDSNLDQARDMIGRQVKHMARLVDDLLDVSRITRGKILLRTERLDLVPLIRAAVEDHRALLESSGLSLAVDVVDQPVLVQGDPTRLAQVVGNLLHNANKFTDAGGRVTVQLEAEPEGAAILTVADTGIGMEPQMLDRLFEPFSQADRSLDRSRGGLGLGLALVKGLAELHGGSVRAASPGLGLGSEFVVRLPLAGSAGQAGQLTAAASGPRRSLRVLVIEDNHDAAESLRLLLTLAGHSAAVAYTGRAGLEAARAFGPDVVLCDIGLPGGMDGYAVARALRADPKLSGVTAIALTGYGQEEDQRMARRAGFDHHLTKPAPPEELHRLLDGVGR